MPLALAARSGAHDVEFMPPGSRRSAMRCRCASLASARPPAAITAAAAAQLEAGTTAGLANARDEIAAMRDPSIVLAQLPELASLIR